MDSKETPLITFQFDSTNYYLEKNHLVFFLNSRNVLFEIETYFYR